MALMEMRMEKPTTVSWKKELLADLENFSGELRWNEALSAYTSLKVGGPADLLLVPRSLADLASVMPVLTLHRLPVFVFGNGSNLLVRDGGIEGAVIYLKHFNRIEQIGANRLLAESGVSYPKLALFAMEQGLSGLEFASGIPGSIGGAVAMNAGIPNAETAQVLERITMMDTSGNIHDFSARDLQFSYRKTTLPEGLILSATFLLRPGPRRMIEAKMKHLLKRRQQTQPLQKPNCGSVFKNPPGQHAGALIEAAGLKGKRIGDAQISERHGNFIVNLGKASACDCLALIKMMQEKVKQKQGIDLEYEVKVVGRD